MAESSHTLSPKMEVLGSLAWYFDSYLRRKIYSDEYLYISKLKFIDLPGAGACGTRLAHDETKLTDTFAQDVADHF